MNRFGIENKVKGRGKNTTTVTMTLTDSRLKEYFKRYCFDNGLKEGDVITDALIAKIGPELERIADELAEKEARRRAS